MAAAREMHAVGASQSASALVNRSLLCTETLDFEALGDASAAPSISLSSFSSSFSFRRQRLEQHARYMEAADATQSDNSRSSTPDMSPIKKRARLHDAGVWRVNKKDGKALSFIVPNAADAPTLLLRVRANHSRAPVPALAYGGPLALQTESDRYTKLLICRVREENTSTESVLKAFAWCSASGEGDTYDGDMQEVLMSIIMQGMEAHRLAPSFVGATYGMEFAERFELPTSGRWERVARQFLGRATSTPHRAIAMVSPYVPGGLAHHALAYCRMTHSNAAAVVLSLCAQQAWALASMYAARIVHADLHVHNYLADYNTAERRTERFVLEDVGGPAVQRPVYRFLDDCSNPTASGSMPLLKIIDYGLSRASSTGIDCVPTLLFYRPPEYILALNPVRAASDLVCAPPLHFSHASDVWSAAFALATILLEGRLPGMTHPVEGYYSAHRDMPPFMLAPMSSSSSSSSLSHQVEPKGTLPGCLAPDAFVLDVERLVALWQATHCPEVHGDGTKDELECATTERVDAWAQNLWRLGWLLGLPRERHWRGIEVMPLWCLLHRHGVACGMVDSPDTRTELAPRLHELIAASLDRHAPDMQASERAALMELLAMQLQWNPARRPTGAYLVRDWAKFADLAFRFRTTATDGAAWTLPLTPQGRFDTPLARKFAEAMEYVD